MAKNGNIDVDAEDPDEFYYGMNYLMIAAQEGETRIIKVLISRGAKVNTVDRMGRSALYFAVSYGHIEAVKILLNNGADVESDIALTEMTPV